MVNIVNIIPAKYHHVSIELIQYIQPYRAVSMGCLLKLISCKQINRLLLLRSLWQ